MEAAAAREGANESHTPSAVVSATVAAEAEAEEEAYPIRAASTAWQVCVCASKSTNRAVALVEQIASQSASQLVQHLTKLEALSLSLTSAVRGK